MAEHVVVANTKDRIVVKEGAKNATYKSFYAANGIRRLTGSYITIGPGGNTVMHQHDAEHIHFVISGQGMLVSEKDGEIALSAGEATYLHGNERHYFKNTGTEPLVLLAVRGPV